ncbi:MAG TPA: DUF1272 domain-containing protein [Flavisolibacter sp.]|jgi:hypothetical protein
MLELRPICENCGKELPNDSNEAMICTFECTFCIDCVTNILDNVCPNCGGGFEKRPVRPTQCVTNDCLKNFPAKTEKKYRPVNMEKFKKLHDHYVNVDPRKR